MHCVNEDDGLFLTIAPLWIWLLILELISAVGFSGGSLFTVPCSTLTRFLRVWYCYAAVLRAESLHNVTKVFRFVLCLLSLSLSTTRFFKAFLILLEVTLLMYRQQHKLVMALGPILRALIKECHYSRWSGSALTMPLHCHCIAATSFACPLATTSAAAVHVTPSVHASAPVFELIHSFMIGMTNRSKGR